MQNVKKYRFVEEGDEIAVLVNEKANELYRKLLGLDISVTAIDDFGKYYFTHHHGGSRLIFSIESSADIIYQSIKLINKPIRETSLSTMVPVWAPFSC